MFNTVTLTFGPIQFKCFIKEVVFQVHNKSLISTFNVFCKLQKLCIILHFPKAIGSLCTNLWIRVKRFRDFVLKNKTKKYQKLLNIKYYTTDRQINSKLVLKIFLQIRFFFMKIVIIFVYPDWHMKRYKLQWSDNTIKLWFSCTCDTLSHGWFVFVLGIYNIKQSFSLCRRNSMMKQKKNLTGQRSTAALWPKLNLLK